MVKESVVKCIVCKNTDIHAFRVQYEKTGYSVVRCLQCHFLFIPSRYRKKINYTRYKSPETAREVARGDSWIKKQRNLLRYRLIQKTHPSGRLLDIGCGFGHFLLTGKELGYQTSGIEMSKANAEFVRKQFQIPVQRGDFLRIPLKREFDVVTLWDTLEHMDHADQVVEKISGILKPGGSVYVQVPQVDGFFSRILSAKWWAMGLDHVNYFSRSTIRRLFNRYGLEVTNIRTSIELKNILVYVLLPKLKPKRRSSPDWSTQDRQKAFNQLTRKPMWIRKLMVVIHNVIYHLLSFFCIGDEMIVTAVKR